MSSRRLVLFPSLPAVQKSDGRIVLTGKFLSGVQAWADRWDGPVSVVFRPAPEAGDNLDNEETRPEEAGIDVRVAAFDAPEALSVLEEAAVAVGMLGVEQNHLPFEARRRGVPFIQTSEYSLKTRLQIAKAEEDSLFQRTKRQAWEIKQEMANLRAIRASSGLQANGTPTFDAYARWNASPMIYFDTRVDRSMVVDEAALEQRLERGGPLRLAFSGRLNPMKGADQLIEVAAELKRRNVDFRLSIAGDGVLRPEMEARIQTLGLGAEVEMVGVLDFESELVPWVAREVDLFVVCHRQGDPSCTYFETLACGVPLVGYDNEALEGVLERFEVGQASPMDDPVALADVIEAVAKDRDRLRRWSMAARRVAASHTFERSMDERVAHAAKLARV